MFGFIKELFCHHELRFTRNIYGDEINWRDGARSLWICKKCDAIKALPNLNNSDETECMKQSALTR